MTEVEWEAVFWDIGGVILDIDSVREGHRWFIERLVEEHEIDASPEDALATWRETVGDYFRERDGTEYRSARDGYARGVEALTEKPIPEEAWRPLFERATERSIRPIPGATETIARVAATDRHVGIISDIDEDRAHRILDQFGVHEHFDSITTSEGVGRTKPDPAMFEAGLDAADVPADRAVMIGDRYDHDMEGASRQGMITVAFGAEDGPGVDYRIEEIAELLDVLDIGSDE